MVTCSVAEKPLSPVHLNSSVPLAVATAETENLMGEKEFRQMKQGAFFINVSRGFVPPAGGAP